MFDVKIFNIFFFIFRKKNMLRIYSRNFISNKISEQ